MVATGETDRLLVMMPPGSAKSTYGSSIFPAWWFTQHPRDSVLSASHTSTFARRWGRRTRNLINEHAETLGYALLTDEHAADQWALDCGGEYGAFGVGAAVTGRRADLVIIDDPVSGEESADSELQRDTLWDWYRSDLITRLKPGGRIILIMTRWHEDDIAGRILREMAEGGDQWRILCLPAIATADKPEDDPLGRQRGEVLWPEWEDAPALARKRKIVGERAWYSLYQQSPTVLEGNIFKVRMVPPPLEAAPAGGSVVRAWDLAATREVGKSDPDWTAGVKLMRMPDDTYVVLDVVHFRGASEEVEASIVNTAHQDGPGVKISMAQDPGQAGKAQAAYLVKKLAGFNVEVTPETGDKATRAAPIASQLNVGNVKIVKKGWNREFLDELAGFPSAAHDDMVDALSRAFSVVGLKSGPYRISDEALRRAMNAGQRRRF